MKLTGNSPVTVKHTYCRLCEPHCPLIAEVDVVENRVVRLKPDRSHPVSRGFACHKGLCAHELNADPDRLNTPMKRISSKTDTAVYDAISWETAISEIADRINTIRQEKPNSLAFYLGNPTAFNSTAVTSSREFVSTLNIQNLFNSGTQDCSNKYAASGGIFGTPYLHPIPDLLNTSYFLSLGSNPAISHGSFIHLPEPMVKLRKVIERGGKVVHVNPRNCESSTNKTGETLLIRPDTDAFFLAALVREIKERGLVDQDWIRLHGKSIEQLWHSVEPFRLPEVAVITGISEERIAQIACEFATAKRASVFMSTGVNMGRQGMIAYWLLNMLSLITGNLGRTGGNIYSPGFNQKLPRGVDRDVKTDIGSVRRVAGTLPGNRLVDFIESSTIQALVCMSGNPVLSIGGESRLTKALQKLDLLVVIDIYPSATGHFADYMLPATDWLEREDINYYSQGFQLEPYVQYTEAMLTPYADRKPEWWIFKKLIEEIQAPACVPDSDPLAKTKAALAASGIEFDDLASAPGSTLQLPLPEPEDLFTRGIVHSDRKVDCFPEVISRGLESCVEQFQTTSAEKSTDDTFLLISMRTKYMVNSWLHNLPSLKRPSSLTNALHMHPEDIEFKSLECASTVKVTSDHGSIRCPLQADESLIRGVVAMTHGWGNANNVFLATSAKYPGVNVNELLPTGPGSYDPLSNMAHMTGISVVVEAAG